MIPGWKEQVREGARRGDIVNNAEPCISGHPKAASPRWSLTMKEMEFFYFSFQFPLLNGEGEEGGG